MNGLLPMARIVLYRPSMLKNFGGVCLPVLTALIVSIWCFQLRNEIDALKSAAVESPSIVRPSERFERSHSSFEERFITRRREFVNTDGSLDWEFLAADLPTIEERSPKVANVDGEWALQAIVIEMDGQQLEEEILKLRNAETPQAFHDRMLDLLFTHLVKKAPERALVLLQKSSHDSLINFRQFALKNLAERDPKHAMELFQAMPPEETTTFTENGPVTSRSWQMKISLLAGLMNKHPEEANKWLAGKRNEDQQAILRDSNTWVQYPETLPQYVEALNKYLPIKEGAQLFAHSTAWDLVRPSNTEKIQELFQRCHANSDQRSAVIARGDPLSWVEGASKEEGLTAFRNWVKEIAPEREMETVAMALAGADRLGYGAVTAFKVLKSHGDLELTKAWATYAEKTLSPEVKSAMLESIKDTELRLAINAIWKQQNIETKP